MSQAPVKTGPSNGAALDPISSPLTTAPFPASRKIYVQGSLPEVRVPMREIHLAPSPAAGNQEPASNPPVTIYDTSGPYTDPNVAIDARAGLAPLRRIWIEDGRMWMNSLRFHLSMAGCEPRIRNWKAFGSVISENL